MSRLLRIAILFAAAAASAAGAEPFAALADELLDGMIARSPRMGVGLGLHASDGRLPDRSPKGIAATTAWLDESLARLAAVDRTALMKLERVEHATLVARLSGWRFSWVEERALERDPRGALSAVGLAPYVTRDYAPLHRRAQAVIAVAKAAPAFLAQAETRLDREIPRTWLETAISQAKGTISFVREDVAQAFAPLASAALRVEVDAALAVLASALETYLAALEGRREEATDDFALGEERFLAKLRATHGIDLSLERLEELFEADLARNRAALVETARAIDPDRKLREVLASVLADKPPANRVLAVATEQAEQLRRGVISLELSSVPGDDPLAVVETPPFLRYNFAFLNTPGPFEPKPLPSFYYITPPDPEWPAEQQAAYLPGTVDLLFASVHEAWPGHFLQSVHRRRIDSRVLRSIGSSATSEGWAHYAEELAWETGLTKGEEAHLGQLVNALLRNVRCLSAIGLHTGGMSVKKSERMFRKVAHQDPGNARQQAWRGTFDPLYLIYTLGKLAIYEMREDYRAQLEARGETFRMKDFHDAFLSYGGAPLPAIRESLLGSESGPPLAR